MVQEKERSLEEKAVREAAAEAAAALKAKEFQQARQAEQERFAAYQAALKQQGLGTDVLRQCWKLFVLPVVGEERMPEFLRTPPPYVPKTLPAPAVETEAVQENGAADPPSTPAPAPKSTVGEYLVPTWAVRRDAVFGRFTGKGGIMDGYLVLLALGCALPSSAPLVDVGGDLKHDAQHLSLLSLLYIFVHLINFLTGTAFAPLRYVISHNL